MRVIWLSEIGLNIRFNVFISHASEDMVLVDKFVEVLRWNNINPLVAEYSQEPGLLLWKDKIKRLIKQSDFFVILYTYTAQNKPKVHQEIGSAGMSNKRIILLLDSGINQNTLPGYLEAIEIIKNLNTFDPSEVFTNAIQCLLNAKYPAWKNINQFYGLDANLGKILFKFDDISKAWNRYSLDSKSGKWNLM